MEQLLAESGGDDWQGFEPNRSKLVWPWLGQGLRLAVAEATPGLSWVVLAGKGRVEEGRLVHDGEGGPMH